MRDDAREPLDKRPRAIVLGVAGERLTAEEKSFFARADPLGFVVFRRWVNRLDIPGLMPARGPAGQPAPRPEATVADHAKI